MTIKTLSPLRCIILDFAGVVLDLATRQPTAGLEVFLQQAQEQELFLGIASSSSRATIQPWLQAFKLEAYFSKIIGGEDVMNPKPDPEGYLEVAMYFQLSASQCLVIDDVAANIQAAQRVKFQTVLFGQEQTNFAKIDLNPALRLTPFAQGTPSPAGEGAGG